MLQMVEYMRNWLVQEEGQDLAEYALLIGLIALIVLAGVTLLGLNLLGVFNDIAGEVGTWFGGGGG